MAKGSRRSSRTILITIGVFLALLCLLLNSVYLFFRLQQSEKHVSGLEEKLDKFLTVKKEVNLRTSKNENVNVKVNGPLPGKGDKYQQEEEILQPSEEEKIVVGSDLHHSSPKQQQQLSSSQSLLQTVQQDKPKLQSVLDQIYVKTGKPYQGDLWEPSHWIPQWMKEYFVWHKQQRSNFTKSNWNTGDRPRIWIIQCIHGMDTHCGGTADRLKLFPFAVREAYDTKRLLFIYWTMPAKLESWLVPPTGGIDWRVPQWMEPIISNSKNGRRYYKVKNLRERGSNDTMIRTRFQSVTGDAEFYNEQLHPGESTFEEVYHDIWRVFFTPSPPVAKWIQSEMDKMELVPGEYAAAHLRALYGRSVDRRNDVAENWTKNALNCASTLRPGGPFLFASDHSYSTTVALAYGEEKQTKVVSRIHDKLPLHLDKVDNFTSLQPSDFYDVFVDLYLMGMSKCLVYNRGGFGHWSLLIGYNSSCGLNQRTSAAGIGLVCNWTYRVVPRVDPHQPIAPLFQEPMV